MTLRFVYKVCVGDWSHDGHGKSDDIIFKCSHCDNDIHKAYYEAVTKCGIGLHGEHDYKHVKTCPKLKFKSILHDYELGCISQAQLDKLLSLGIKLENLVGVEKGEEDYEYEDDKQKTLFYTVSPKGVAHIFLEMVKSQLSGFEYEIWKIEPINGWWGKFNHAMGYGCYN